MENKNYIEEYIENCTSRDLIIYEKNLYDGLKKFIDNIEKNERVTNAIKENAKFVFELSDEDFETYLKKEKLSTFIVNLYKKFYSDFLNIAVKERLLNEILSIKLNLKNLSKEDIIRNLTDYGEKEITFSVLRDYFLQLDNLETKNLKEIKNSDYERVKYKILPHICPNCRASGERVVFKNDEINCGYCSSKYSIYFDDCATMEEREFLKREIEKINGTNTNNFTATKDIINNLKNEFLNQLKNTENNINSNIDKQHELTRNKIDDTTKSITEIKSMIKNFMKQSTRENLVEVKTLNDENVEQVLVYSATNKEKFNYIVENDNIIIKGIKDSMLKDIIVPEKIDDLYVTKIMTGAFYNCSHTKRIVIPYSVKQIDKGAFGGCGALEEITLPFVGDRPHTDNDRCVYPFGYIFGTNAYPGSTSITQFYFNNSRIDDVYQVPISLKKLTISGTENINSYALSNCVNLQEVIIGDSVKNIGNYVFTCCSNLERVIIGKNVKKIGREIFNYCSHIEIISIPFISDREHKPTDQNQYSFGYHFGSYNSESSDIEQSYYENKAKISKVFKIPDSLKCVYLTNCEHITFGAFSNMLNLKTIIIGKSIQSIQSLAFLGCTSLENIIFENGSNIKTIERNAFSGCMKLKDITLPKSLMTINNSAFSRCKNIESVTFEENIGWKIDGKILFSKLKLIDNRKNAKLLKKYCYKKWVRK